MIQDIEPKHLYNEYTPHDPKPGDKVFAYDGKSFLGAWKDGGICLPEADEIGKKLPGEVDLIYMFRVDAVSYYLAMTEERFAIDGYEQVRASGKFRSLLPEEMGFVVSTAVHLYTWYSSHQYCGKCGGKMVSADKERAMQCTSCSHRAYPVICPAVIVAVTDGDRILSTRYAGRDYKGVALIAGFCEIGETAEQTVAREVMEEVGIRVKNIRYYTSQPWGINSDLLLGFYCDLDGDDHLHPDFSELSEAHWIRRNELPDFGKDISLTLHMVSQFRKGEYPR